MRLVITFLLAAIAPAIAQQATPQRQPDAATLQKAVMSYREMLARANDQVAEAETRAALLQDENAKLTARIQELIRQLAEKAAPPPPPGG